MEIHEEFKKWAVERRVKINGVSAHRFEGRGLGIVADKKLEVCKTVCTCDRVGSDSHASAGYLWLIFAFLCFVTCKFRHKELVAWCCVT